MRLINLVAITCIMFCTVLSNAQGLVDNSFLTPKGYFDTLRDYQGRKFLLKDYKVKIDDPTDSRRVSAATMCSAGIFNVYFAAGSGMELNNALHSQRRALVCELFSNVSGFLGGTAGWPVNFRINILADDIASNV